MGALDGLDVQVTDAVVLANSGVTRVRERTGALVAQPRHVVLVSETETETYHTVAMTPQSHTSENERQASTFPVRTRNARYIDVAAAS